MQCETPIRRPLLQTGSPRAAENSIRYTVRIEFPISYGKQRTELDSNRYKMRLHLASRDDVPGRRLLASRCIEPGRSLQPSRRLAPRHFSFANLSKINRNIKLIESPVSHSKQRIAHQINRKLSRPESAAVRRSNGSRPARLDAGSQSAAVRRSKGARARSGFPGPGSAICLFKMGAARP